MTRNKAPVGRWLLDLIILTFWLYLIYDSYAEGKALPGLLQSLELPDLPLIVFALSAFIFGLVASVITFWQRHNIMDELPVISTYTDKFFGEGTYQGFMSRYRPIAASVVSSMVLASVGLYNTYHGPGTPWSYGVCFCFMAYAVCMSITMLISKRNPPVLR